MNILQVKSVSLVCCMLSFLLLSTGFLPDWTRYELLTVREAWIFARYTFLAAYGFSAATIVGWILTYVWLKKVVIIVPATFTCSLNVGLILIKTRYDVIVPEVQFVLVISATALSFLVFVCSFVEYCRFESQRRQVTPDSTMATVIDNEFTQVGMCHISATKV